MDNYKIADFIKKKRKLKKLTQKELADKLFVTEKAISRWETGRGLPEVSLLLPLSEILDVSVSDILNGGEKEKKEDKVIKNLIGYVEENKKSKYKTSFILSVVCYIISIFIFLYYLKIDYQNINLVSKYFDYFIKLILIVVSSIFIIIGNYNLGNNYLDKIYDKNKLKKVSNLILMIYYLIFIFNLGMFARVDELNRVNLIPFNSIIQISLGGSLSEILINILGNFFIFMPISYFLIEIFDVKKIWKISIISFIFLFLFECIQYIFKIGIFDVDDIILGLFGIITFYIWYSYFKKFSIKNKIILLFSSIVLFILLSYCFILLGSVKINLKYDEEVMNCEIKNNVIYSYVGSNVIISNSIVKEKGNEKIYFYNYKVEVKNLLFHNEQINGDIYSSRGERNINGDDIVFVYYTNISLNDIDKIDYEDLDSIIDNSYLMCTNLR